MRNAGWRDFYGRWYLTGISYVNHWYVKGYVKNFPKANRMAMAFLFHLSIRILDRDLDSLISAVRHLPSKTKDFFILSVAGKQTAMNEGTSRQVPVRKMSSSFVRCHSSMMVKIVTLFIVALLMLRYFYSSAGDVVVQNHLEF